VDTVVAVLLQLVSVDFSFALIPVVSKLYRSGVKLKNGWLWRGFGTCFLAVFIVASRGQAKE